MDNMRNVCQLYLVEESAFKEKVLKMEQQKKEMEKNYEEAIAFE